MNTVLSKIFEYGIYILLFCCFVIFSHILYLFGVPIAIELFGIGGYEGIKSMIVMLFGIFSLIFLMLFQEKTSHSKLWFWSSIIFIAVFISSIFSIGTNDFFFGLSEKHHSGAYYISLLFLFIGITIGYKKKNYIQTLYVIFALFVTIGIYAILQKLGADPLSQYYQTRVSLDRVFSSLGNANYLAGLSIILLPLTQLIKNQYYKYGLFAFCLVILLLTKSYFGSALVVLYLLYKTYSINKKLFFTGLIIFLTISFQIFNNLGIEKLGSMKARPYIWMSSIGALIDSPKSFIIGNGPDTLQEVFHLHKHEKLNIYETPSYTADRSHNIFIDLLYFFGIIGGGIIIFFLLYAIKKSKNRHIGEALVLFYLFFSFNIAVSAHFIVLLILLAGIYSNKWE